MATEAEVKLAVKKRLVESTLGRAVALEGWGYREASGKVLEVAIQYEEQVNEDERKTKEG